MFITLFYYPNLIIAGLIGAVLVGFAGINKKGGYWRAFLLSLFLTPVIGLFLTIGSGAKNPIGCPHCGNRENEAAFCGICGKNQEGKLKNEVLGNNK